MVKRVAIYFRVKVSFVESCENTTEDKKGDGRGKKSEKNARQIKVDAGLLNNQTHNIVSFSLGKCTDVKSRARIFPVKEKLGLRLGFFSHSISLSTSLSLVRSL